MHRRLGGEVTPDVVSYNTTLKALLAAGHVHDAAALHRSTSLAAPRLHMASALYYQFIEAAAAMGAHDVVVYMWDAMERVEVPPAPPTVSAYLGAALHLVRAFLLFMGVALLV